MENQQLPREEALARMLELRNQLDLFDAIRWSECEDLGAGKCDDCGDIKLLRRYGNVHLCESDGMSRIRVAALRDHKRRQSESAG